MEDKKDNICYHLVLVGVILYHTYTYKLILTISVPVFDLWSVTFLSSAKNVLEKSTSIYTTQIYCKNHKIIYYILKQCLSYTCHVSLWHKSSFIMTLVNMCQLFPRGHTSPCHHVRTSDATCTCHLLSWDMFHCATLLQTQKQTVKNSSFQNFHSLSVGKISIWCKSIIYHIISQFFVPITISKSRSGCNLPSCSPRSQGSLIILSKLTNKAETLIHPHTRTQVVWPQYQ